MTEDEGEGEEDGLFRELLHDAQEQPQDNSDLLGEGAGRAREGARRLITPPPRIRNRDRSRDRDRERNRNRRNDNYRFSHCATHLLCVSSP